MSKPTKPGKPPKEMVGLMMRVTPATAARFRAFAAAMHTNHAGALVLLMNSGQRWVELHRKMVFGRFDRNQEAFAEAMELMKSEIDLRVRAKRLFKRLAL